MNSSVRSLRSEKPPETSTRTAATFEALQKERWMTKPENHHERVSETEGVLEHLIFFYKTGQKQSSQTLQRHRSKMVCETSARHFFAQCCNQESEKKCFNTTKNIFEFSRKQCI